MARHLAVLIGLLGVAACGGAPPSPHPARLPADSTAAQRATPRPPGPAAPATSSAPVASAPACAPGFSPLDAPPGEPPWVEILSPFAEQTLKRARALEHAIRIQREPPGPVAVALDAHPPRRFAGVDRVRLRELLPEDSELTDGEHRLVVAALDDRGVAHRRAGEGSRGPAAAVSFHVAARGPAAPRGPFLVLLSPRGTYNGVLAADSMVVDALALGFAEVPVLEVEVSGAGVRAQGTLEGGRPGVAYGLPSGDLEVTVRARVAAGSAEPAASASRVVTLNLDAPAPSPPIVAGDCRSPRPVPRR